MKYEIYGDLVDQSFLQFNENLIKNQEPRTAKLKMMKHHAQNIPMKVIQKKEKQTKLLYFPISCHKYYLVMKPQKV